VHDVVDLFLLSEHDVERRHDMADFDRRFLNSGFGEVLGVFIA
jgi:hypothetical protein